MITLEQLTDLLHEIFDPIVEDQRRMALRMTRIEKPQNQRKREQISAGDGRTEQSHRDRTDIKKIMKKAEATGIISHLAKTEPTFMDVSTRTDFDESMRIVVSAQQSFEMIPAEIRADFNHDPAQWLDFITDPENRKEMEQYGFTTEHLPPIDETPSKPSEPPTANEGGDPSTGSDKDGSPRQQAPAKE